MEDKLITYGGQAIIEGVMMRGRKTCAMAMRAPDGTIVTKMEPLGVIYKSPVAKIPFLRGLILLWDSLGLGLRALTDAANVQTGEDEKIEGPVLYLTLGFTFLVAIAIFFLTPAGVGWLTEHFLHWNAWWSNLLEGVIRLLFLVGYMSGIGFMPEIRRVFAYHGAEHKAINALEAGVPMSVDNVKRYSRLHPRCGTSFIFITVIVSIVLFPSFFRNQFLHHFDQRHPCQSNNPEHQKHATAADTFQ